MPLLKKKRSIWFWLGIFIGIPLLLITVGIFLLIVTSPPNYGKKEWQIADKYLITRGTQKVCDYGDNGVGIDNTQPWYLFFYQFNTNSAEALIYLQNAAKAQGFILETSSDDAQGNTVFVSNKVLNEGEFKGQPLTIKVTLVNDSETISRLWCHTKEDLKIYSDSTHTGVFVSASLPDRKDL